MKFEHKRYPSAVFSIGNKSIQFKEGKAETDDKDLQKALENQPDIVLIEEKNDDKPVAKMNKTELVDYAKEHEIEINPDDKVDDIRKVIIEAEKE